MDRKEKTLKMKRKYKRGDIGSFCWKNCVAKRWCEEMDKSEKGRLKKSAGRKDEEKQSRRRPHKEAEKKLGKEKKKEKKLI